jgi:hypothetical protein
MRLSQYTVILILFVIGAPAQAWQSNEVGVTSGCADEVSRQVRVCHPSKPITTYSTEIVSRNCTGDIRGERVEQGCVVYDLYARGCGEDKILSIRNCRGRGWISLKVTTPD